MHTILLAPLDLIARLCALIPPPRFHMLRYHGPTQLRLSFDGEATELEAITRPTSPAEGMVVGWTEE